MPYEIYSDDVVDSNSNQTRKTQPQFTPQDPSGPPQQRPPFDKTKILIITLHLLLILGAFFLIYVIFFTPFIFQEDSNFKLTGELSNFSTQLNQTLRVSVNEYSLNLDNSTQLSGVGEQFKIHNFTGELKFLDESLYLSGTSDKINTQTSSINTKDKTVEFRFENGGVDLFLEHINLTITNALDITYRPELIYSSQKETQIIIQEFNGTLSYDKLLSLYGNIELLEIQNNASYLKFE